MTLAVAGVVLCLMLMASAADATSIAVKGKFTQVGRGELIGDANDVVVYGQTGLLIDAATGQHTAVTQPGCSSAAAVGGTHIVFFCQGGYRVYTIPTGQSRSLACGGSSPAECSAVTGVGSDWVAFADECVDHCVPGFEYQDLETGAMVADPTTAHVIPDLNSPTLAHRLCQGVTVPAARAGQAHGAPWVSLEGRFAVATSQSGSYLERCGSRLHLRLTFTSYPGCAHQTCPPPATSHAVVWESKPRQLTGIFLPSLRRFTMTLPAKVDPTPGPYVNGDQYSLVLTTHTLYVGHNQGVWATPIPTTPPRVTKQHGRAHERA